MDPTEAAKRHRHQAEECRAKADLVGDVDTRAQYRRIADACDVLAANEEQMASHPAIASMLKDAE